MRSFRPDTDHLTDPQLVPRDVALAEIRIGEPLARELVDDQGVLLLARGAVLTETMVDLLHQRRVAAVTVFRAPPITQEVRKAVPAPTKKTRAALLRRESAERVRQTTESQFTIISNTGQAVAEALPNEAAGNWNPRVSESTTTTTESIATILGEMYDRDTTSKEIEGQVFVRLAENIRSLLVDDMDSALGVVLGDVLRRKPGEDVLVTLPNRTARMAFLATAIAIHCGLNVENVNRVSVAALVHDWGWVGVAEPARTSELDADVAEIEIRKHPLVTRRILERVTGLPSLVLRIALQVHERPDGTGYPRGETGRQLHFLSRVVATADRYLELRNGEAGSPSEPHEAVGKILREAASQKLDSTTVRGLLQATSAFPIGSDVRLSDGRNAKVLRSTGDTFTSPIISIADKNTERPPAIIDLRSSHLEIVAAGGKTPIPKPHFARSRATQRTP